MIQQTIDVVFNPSDEIISQDLKQTMHRAGVADELQLACKPPIEGTIGCRNTGIHHVGLRATNPAASAEFYRDILGMEIVGGSAPDHPIGATAFFEQPSRSRVTRNRLIRQPRFRPRRLQGLVTRRVAILLLTRRSEEYPDQVPGQPRGVIRLLFR